MPELREIFLEVAAHQRACAVATVGGFRPPTEPLASWFGGRFVAAEGEPWPENHNGPLLPLLQAVAHEVPVWPDQLAGCSVLQVFIDREEYPLGTPVSNGSGWLLRTYDASARLVPSVDPAPKLRPFPIRWRLEEADFPGWEEVGTLVDPRDLRVLADHMLEYFKTFAQVDGTKIGGWPAKIQGSDCGDLDFVLQVASEPKCGWTWGDGGNAYVFQDREGGWVLYWDCY